MRSSPTLSLYFVRETLLYGGLSFVTLTVVLVSQNALRRLEDLVSVGVTLDDFVHLLGYLLPMLVAYTLPIAFLFGVFFAIARMSSDGEILAVDASGLGPEALLMPALALGLTVSLLTAYVMIAVEHRAHRSIRTLVETLAARGGMLEEGEFRTVYGRTIHVEERNRRNELRGVMISDLSNPTRPFLIFAEDGRFSFDEQAAKFNLELRQGAMHLQGDDADGARSRRISFERLEYAFDVTALIQNLTSAVRPRQMTHEELKGVIERARGGDEILHGLDQKNPVEYELEIHRRFALPVAPVLFGLMAVPIGLGRAGRTRSRGALMSVLLAFAYYSLFSQAKFMAVRGGLPASLVLWLPNLVFLIVGVVLFVRARRFSGS